MELPHALAVPCHCTDVIRELDRLADLMDTHNLTFTGTALYDGGEASEEPLRVFNLVVNCETCRNMRQVLTPYGQRLALMARAEESKMKAEAPYLTPFRVRFPIAVEENPSPCNSDV